MNVQFLPLRRYAQVVADALCDAAPCKRLAKNKTVQFTAPVEIQHVERSLSFTTLFDFMLHLNMPR